MAESMPVFPKAATILLRTGNIVNWDRLKRKLNQNPTEEVTDCINTTLNTWLPIQNKTDLQYATDLQVSNNKNLEKIDESEREEYKITVKLFVSVLEPGLVKEAIATVSSELGISSIETVLVSLPKGKNDLVNIQPIWTELEELVDQEKVFSLGTSDLDRDTLEELYNWAKVKPCVNQLNLEVCCVISPEMQEFAKEHDIQLLTHNDPQEILPVESLKTAITESVGERDASNWIPAWTIRTSIMIKSRGVIKLKEYIVKATRDIKIRNS